MKFKWKGLILAPLDGPGALQLGLGKSGGRTSFLWIHAPGCHRKHHPECWGWRKHQAVTPRSTPGGGEAPPKCLGAYFLREAKGRKQNTNVPRLPAL